MATLPPFNTKAYMEVIGINDFWSYDDGTGTDYFVGFPYKWDVRITVDVQAHGSGATSFPLYYTGSDVKEGMWLAGTTDGLAWQITTINSNNGSVLECVIEDIDRFNVINDPQQAGAAPGFGTVALFSLSEDGQPILSAYPSSTFLDNFPVALVSRFAYRNNKSKYVPVKQTAHGLSVDDFIYLTSDGSYQAIAASNANKLLLSSIVGQVTTVTSLNSFDFQPRGDIRKDVTLPMDSVPGQLIYLDPSAPGKLTATRPAKLATPMYIRLVEPNTGIYMGAGSGGGAVDEDELRFATVYRVANLAARDAIDVTKLKEGDQAYVSDAGGGEWALFMVNSKTLTPLAVTWTKLVDMDASNVDGRTVGVTFRYNALPTQDIYRISPTDRVTVVTVDVTEAFHTSATLTVGDDADHERLVSDQHIDLSVVDTYTITPSYQYGGTDESWIRAYLSAGSSTTGSVRVTISYI